jgi:hypothetical protein
MATELEIRKNDRSRLGDLLTVKKALKGQSVPELDMILTRIVYEMLDEDVALVEKILGVKALD